MDGNHETTKSELVERISERTRLPRARAELVVNCVFDSMIDALKRGDGIEIRGFGSFTVRSYKAYDGRNPRTGEIVHVEPKRLPFFRVGKELGERIRGSRPDGAGGGEVGGGGGGNGTSNGTPG